jgi:hypothetical protein
MDPIIIAEGMSEEMEYGPYGGTLVCFYDEDAAIETHYLLDTPENRQMISRYESN